MKMPEPVLQTNTLLAQKFNQLLLAHKLETYVNTRLTGFIVI